MKEKLNMGRTGGGGGGRGGRMGGGARGGRGGRGGRPPREESEFDHQVVDLARVTRVTKGGKRMRFRALIVVGDHKGRVGFGLEKGADVSMAINKATRAARKHLMHIPLKNETIPHEAYAKFGAARVKIMPAPKGSGIIAGGAVRIVLEMAGVPNCSSKMLGGKNKTNNIKATFAALAKLRTV